VLNLFGYTGASTLAAARAGAAVAHVDASRPAVAWARRNAELSGLTDRPIRWLVDDAEAFVAREARRGRRYDGIVLDPPSYGHGRGGRAWRLEERLTALLGALASVATAGAFILLTAHTPGFDGEALADELAAAFALPLRDVDRGPMTLRATSGATLELGSFARWPRSADRMPR
jgi:23S rRNA (cytosine1962-C5)-methyltransferase